MKVRSSLFCHGWHSAVTFLDGDFGSMFRVVRLETDSGGFVQLYLNVTLSYWDWKLSPKIKSEQSPGITDRWKSL